MTEQAVDVGQMRESADGTQRVYVTEQTGWPAWTVRVLRGSALSGSYTSLVIRSYWPVVVALPHVHVEVGQVRAHPARGVSVKVVEHHAVGAAARWSLRVVDGGTMPGTYTTEEVLARWPEVLATAKAPACSHPREEWRSGRGTDGTRCGICGARVPADVVRAARAADAQAAWAASDAAVADPSTWHGTTLDQAVEIFVEHFAPDADSSRRPVLGGLVNAVLSRFERRLLAKTREQARQVALTEIAYTDLHGVPEAAMTAAARQPGPGEGKPRREEAPSNHGVAKVPTFHFVAVDTDRAPCGIGFATARGLTGGTGFSRWTSDARHAPVTCPDCRALLGLGETDATAAFYAQEMDAILPLTTYLSNLRPAVAMPNEHAATVALRLLKEADGLRKNLYDERDRNNAALVSQERALRAVEAHRDQLDRDLVTAVDEIAHLRWQRDMAQTKGTALLERARAAEAIGNRTRLGVSVLIVRDDPDGPQLLLGQRDGALGAGSWSPPGGHPERGESPQEAAVREVAEETGIALSASDLQQLDGCMDGVIVDPCSWTFDREPSDWPTYVTLWFVVHVPASTTAERREPNKCCEWRWIGETYEWPDPLFRCFGTLLTGLGPTLLWTLLTLKPRTGRFADRRAL